MVARAWQTRATIPAVHPFSVRPIRPRAVVCAVAVLAACGNNPAGPDSQHPPLNEVSNSAHYVIRTSPGDRVDAAWQDQYYDWLVAALALDAGGRLEYHKYRDRAHLEALTGRDTNGFAEPGTPRFHTIWPTDNHEGVHTLVVLHIGHPPALFNEGVAVAHHTDPAQGVFTPRWNGTSIHELARQHDAAGRLPALNALLRSPGFFDFDTNITYPCAGSFVRYLIDTEGLAKFKVYVRSARFEDPADGTEALFQATYGRSLGSIWQDWRAWLR